MKRSIIFFIAALLTLLICYSGQDLQSQPPNPPSGHGLNGNQGARGYAPVDGGGLLLLLRGGLGYSVVKVRRRKRGNQADVRRET